MTLFDFLLLRIYFFFLFTSEPCKALPDELAALLGVQEERRRLVAAFVRAVFPVIFLIGFYTGKERIVDFLLKARVFLGQRILGLVLR